MENVKAVGSRRIEIAISQGGIAVDAFCDQDTFAGKALDTLRAVANLFAQAVHFVVRGDSEITTDGDMKGRWASLGEPESGILMVARTIVDAYRFNVAGLVPFFENQGKAGDMLTRNELDAFVIVSAYPMFAFAHTAERVDIHLVSIRGPGADRIRNKYALIDTDFISEETCKWGGGTARRSNPMSCPAPVC